MGINESTKLSPIIFDYAYVEYKNPRDHTVVTFIVKGDSKEIIKWCRRNFGQRGDGWDFMAGTRDVQLTIWSSKLITMYELWMN